DHLIVDPPKCLFHAVAKPDRRGPAERPLDFGVVTAAAPDTFGRAQVIPAFQLHSGNLFDDVDERIDRDELVTPDVEWVANRARHQGSGSVEAIVDVHEA